MTGGKTTDAVAQALVAGAWSESSYWTAAFLLTPGADVG
jgi:hypothetical protein